LGLYINSNSVIIRLRGKVKVTNNPDQEPDRMPLILLNRIVNESEGQVEWDLSTRYTAPFQGYNGEPFSQLPERPTKEILRTLCELLSVVRVLETDFGRGSVVDASKYSDTAQTRYTKVVESLIELRQGTFNTFRRPPLPGLRPNYMVSAADNGFAGYVTRTDDTGHGGYPALQINSPSETFWNGFLDSDEQQWTDGQTPPGGTNGGTL
jgi:hypothetical protein